MNRWRVLRGPLSAAQEQDTAVVSDTTGDDLWFLEEGESERVSVEMKEAVPEAGAGGEGEASPEAEQEDTGAGKEDKADGEVGRSAFSLVVRLAGGGGRRRRRECSITFLNVFGWG